MDRARRIDPERSAAPEHPIPGESSRIVVTRRTSYAKGHHIAPHWHARAQLIYAVEGTMTVRSQRQAWIVPPSRALWMPPRIVHEIRMHSVVEMHSLYLTPPAAAAMPAESVVLEVTPLMRELVVRAVSLPAQHADSRDEGPLMRLLLVELTRLHHCPLHLPLPASGDLVQLCERILADLSARRPCAQDADEMNLSTRTLYRRFLAETGVTFARWKQQARVLESIRRLAGGASVTEVALDLGYESTSAFSTMFRRSVGVAPREFGVGLGRGRG
ncbi:MAG TPA: helix-turn-helix transcriptional regulator [Ramlibacter sp.]|uniref:AraC family transcriptional regulator n=1 Tax=Ramlibacter sp. TaxID=1917967 RepID=UPI002D7E4E85|nr:helix-turn-helix transcriptional regulator [Ramlibacter sp.]HET8747708.1 helix-turn-helix transcriptional regulator [Ramlibacter sp.]